ncbi:MAG: undecaprenyl-diphosphate phosphatase [Thermoleophilaceae bacterium]
MSALEAIVLGIAQGLTEFLPISSTGHLRILPAFFGWEDPGAAFTAVTQLGTMAAVLLYFREDLARIARAWLRSVGARDWRPADRDARIGWYILLGTIPIGIFGIAFKDQIETGARDLYLIATMLIVLGLVLLAAERVGKRERGMESLGVRDGVAVGFAQALALVPGVSRSGATITAGLFLGLDREAAARFSFLLSIPAVVLSGLLEGASIASGEEGGETTTGALILATFLAFVSGYAAIAFLLRFLQTHSMIVFVVYRIALGLLVFALLGTGAIE